MADKDSNDDEFSNFRRRNRRDGEENTCDDLEASSDNPGEPDIGLGHAQRRSEGQKYGEMNAESSRREDTGSFSFKHFLQGHNNSTGARPKVYDNSRYEAKENYRRHVNTPELASVLPDFVQDHLVVEQCYLADSDSTLDIDNLPDFALSGSAADLDLPLDLGQRASNEQLPFDLTQLNSRLNFNAPQRNASSNSNDSFRLPSNIYMNRPSDRVLNLDLAQSNVVPSSNETLPLDLAQGSAHLGNTSGNTGTRPANESLPCDLGLGNAQAPLDLRVGDVGPVENPVSQSLPDFLSDGPIQCGRESEGLPGPEIVEQRDRDGGEIERLRRQLSEASRRSESLEAEVRRCREAAHHREEALRRANSELAALRRENATLRQGAGEGHTDARTQRVARELMAATTHAELSLRTLLSGVESLRLLASSLDQGPSPPRPHSSSRSTAGHEFDPEDRAGPAL